MATTSPATLFNPPRPKGANGDKRNRVRHFDFAVPARYIIAIGIIGVTVVPLLYVINHTASACNVPLPVSLHRDLLSGETVSGDIALAAGRVLVLKPAD